MDNRKLVESICKELGVETDEETNVNIEYISNYIISNPNATFRQIVNNTKQFYLSLMPEDEFLSLVALKLRARQKYIEEEEGL